MTDSAGKAAEEVARPTRNPRCYPVRPHVRRGNKLYCATCDKLIMTFH